jgi:hypothetical protein
MPRANRGTTSFAQDVQYTDPISTAPGGNLGAGQPSGADGSLTALSRGSEAIQAQLDEMAAMPTVEDIIAGGPIPTAAAPMAPQQPAININLGQGGGAPSAGGLDQNMLEQLLRFDANSLRGDMPEPVRLDASAPTPPTGDVDLAPKGGGSLVPGDPFAADPVEPRPVADFDPVEPRPVAPQPPSQQNMEGRVAYDAMIQKLGASITDLERHYFPGMMAATVMTGISPDEANFLGLPPDFMFGDGLSKGAALKRMAEVTGQPAPEPPPRPGLTAPPGMDLTNRKDPRVIDFLRRQSPDRLIKGVTYNLTPEQIRHNEAARARHDEQTMEIFGPEAGRRMTETRKKLDGINDQLRDGKISLNQANEMRDAAHGVVDPGPFPGSTSPVVTDNGMGDPNINTDAGFERPGAPPGGPRLRQGGGVDNDSQDILSYMMQRQITQDFKQPGQVEQELQQMGYNPRQIAVARHHGIQQRRQVQARKRQEMLRSYTPQNLMSHLRKVTSNKLDPNRRKNAINFLREVEQAGGTIPANIRQRLTRRALPKTAAAARQQAGNPRAARRNAKAVQRRSRLDRIRARRRGRRR